MKTHWFLAALTLAMGCGAPDPDPTGRIHGSLDGGGVTGCSVAAGQEGRTLTYTRTVASLTDGGAIGVSRIDFATMTWCCPRGSTFAECPARALVQTSCMGGWPDTPCPSTTVFTGHTCRSDRDCGMSELCVAMPEIGDGGGILLSEGTQRCLARCTLSQGNTNAPFALCGDGHSICAPAPNHPPESRRGVCYPTR